jgi:choline transport protein
MTDTAKVPVVEGEPYDVDVVGEDDVEVSEKKGTSADRHAMWRMGKVQEMRVGYCSPV